MVKELEEHLKMWDGTPYSIALVEDIYDLGYDIGKKYTTQQFKEYLERRKKQAEEATEIFDDELHIRIHQSKINLINEIFNELFKKGDQK